MTPETVTLVLGLAGLLATLASSGMGLYFTARARRSPIRELLYARQLDLILRILRVVGRARLCATILVSDDETFKEQARDDMRIAVSRLSHLTNDAAALLPTDLFAEVRKLSDIAVDVVSKIEESEPTTSIRLEAQAAKTALMARALLGVDELSDESMKLISGKSPLLRLSAIELREFRRRR